MGDRKELGPRRKRWTCRADGETTDNRLSRSEERSVKKGKGTRSKRRGLSNLIESVKGSKRGQRILLNLGQRNKKESGGKELKTSPFNFVETSKKRNWNHLDMEDGK